jgi:hypothetical protein
MMRDQQEEYPRHQPGRAASNHHDPFSPDVQSEGELEPQGGPVHQRAAATTPQLPPGHARKSLIIGIIFGILVALQGTLLILFNADLYKEAADPAYLKNPSSMPEGLAFHILGITLLSLLFSAILYFIGGLIIGRVAVHRRWAFIGGFVGGVVNWVIGLILNQIPAYPGAGHTGFASSALGIGGGIATALIGVIILSVLSGAVCLFGAWLATRRHPYYVGYYG